MAGIAPFLKTAVSQDVSPDRHGLSSANDVSLAEARAVKIGNPVSWSRSVLQARHLRSDLRTLERQPDLQHLRNLLAAKQQLLTVSPPVVLSRYRFGAFDHRDIGAIVLGKFGFEFACATQLQSACSEELFFEIKDSGESKFPWVPNLEAPPRSLTDFGEHHFVIDETSGGKEGGRGGAQLGRIKFKPSLPVRELAYYQQAGGVLEFGDIRMRLEEAVEKLFRAPASLARAA